MCRAPDALSGPNRPAPVLTGPREAPAPEKSPSDVPPYTITVPITHAADNDKENTQPTGSTSEETETRTEAPEEETAPSQAAPESPDESPDEKESKPKKNRCAVCRKKVGLTGFLCRCGGLYCAVHRYSDKHDCTFDYRELGAREIRRNNPVVVGEKIQKI